MIYKFNFVAETTHISNCVSQREYVKVICCLMFLMNCTRLDIAYVVSRLSTYTHNPI